MQKKLRYKKPSIKLTKFGPVKLRNNRRSGSLAFDSFLIPDVFATVSYDGCLLPDTKILMANKTVKKIKLLKRGDTVLSFDEDKKKLSASKIKEVPKSRSDEYLILNEKLKVTREHRLYINGEWIPAERLSIGDRLMDSHGKKIYVQSIVLKKRIGIVYNLTLEGKNKNFYAENFLVHNMVSNSFLAGTST